MQDHLDESVTDKAMCAFMDEWEKSQGMGSQLDDDDSLYSVLCGVDCGTGDVVKPGNAIKTRRYKCLVCSDQLHVKAGPIRRKHFSHMPKSSCKLFSGGESELHLYAKVFLQRFLDDGGIINVSAAGECHGVPDKFGRCSTLLQRELAVVRKSELGSIKLEFGAPDRSWVADLAVCSADEVLFLLEVKHTHKTENFRPEPWFEFDARDICEISGSQCHLYDVREDRKIYCNNCALMGEPWLLRIPKIPYKRGLDGGWKCLPGNWPCILCGRSSYKSVWEKGSRQCCVICLGNQTDDVKRALDRMGL